MDPLTAVAFAGTIITFVDFSWSLLTGTCDVYRSSTGMTQQNARIGDVIKDLRDVSDDLEEVPAGNSKHEKALRNLAQDCSELATELIDLLKKLRRTDKKNTVWSSFKVKWASLMKADEMEDMSERLRDYRSEIMLRLNLMLSDQQSAIAKQLEQVRSESHELRSTTAKELEKIRDEILSAVKAVRETEADEHLPAQNSSEDRENVIQNNRFGSIHALLVEFVSRTQTMDKQHKILRQLNFGSRLSREDSIHDAETGTFEWMLGDGEDNGHSGGEEDADKRRRDPVFLTWLREGSHIFHISGKAGSGKSTLVKFLYHDQRTKGALREWAGGKELIMAHFYFWRGSQDQVQMSLDGLYRSVLFEVLCQCPDLIPKVFPKQWDSLGHSVEAWQISAIDIKNGFQLFASSMAANSTHRFCFFIDGLDEFQGDSAAHWEMARDLQALSRQTDDLKICASARPHTEFLVTFDAAENTIIHLHELTRDDISSFSRQMFGKDPNASALQEDFLENLCQRITAKAEGVFLWAWLTVRLLLDSIGRLDKPETLLQRLEGVPDGLDELYDKLLGGVLASDRDRSDLMFVLALKNPFTTPLYAIQYFWLDEIDDPDFPTNTEFQPLQYTEMYAGLDYVRRQLNSLTKGLLELCPPITIDSFWRPAENQLPKIMSHQIQFFHRTALDYLARTQLSKFQDRYAKLNVTETIVRLRLAHLLRGKDHMESDHQNFMIEETISESKDRLSSPIMGTFKAAIDKIGLGMRFDGGMFGPVVFLPFVLFEESHGSWPHFAAAFGHRQYVLDLVRREPSLLCPDDKHPGPNLLMSAVAGKHKTLVVSLMNHGASPHSWVEVKPSPWSSQRKFVTNKVPVWLCAVGHAIRAINNSLWSFHGKLSPELTWAIETVRLFINYGEGEDLLLHIESTVQVYSRGLGNNPQTRQGSIRDIAEALKDCKQTFSFTVAKFLKFSQSRVGEFLSEDSVLSVEDTECDIARFQQAIESRDRTGLVRRSDSKVMIQWGNQALCLPFKFRVY
ncbi:vegetative incompatibility HET-E-1 protein [Cladorrhinum sp. PSN332]|nr:vegetative incompatibility HET-E-1 protein [Cladorrhinum sp. PSN332]